MVGVIIAVIAVVVLLILLMSNFHVFTAYTFDIDEAYSEFYKWKKHYEQTTNQEVIILDIKYGGTYVDFYYKTKIKKK